MGIIKSIPCGSLTLEAYRNDSGEILVELKELLPGGKEGRKIVWSDLSEDELRRAEEYVIRPARDRQRGHTVSEANGTKIVMLTLDYDRKSNTILLHFARNRQPSVSHLLVTLTQEKLAAFLRHVIQALRLRPGEYAH